MKQNLKSLIKRLIPKHVRTLVRRLVRRPVDYRRVAYSQEGEDLILAALLELEEIKRPGFYVDVGAYHPRRFSNTFLFYTNGWRGINIDATPGSMKAFNRERPRDINIEAAVGDGTERTFYQFNEPALSGFCRDRVAPGFHGWNIIGEHKLVTTTLATLLEKNLPPNTSIDFMTVDVEGLALQVLKSNDWKRFRPIVVLVEDDDVNKFNQDSDVGRYLASCAYEVCCKTPLTTFFVQQDQLVGGIRGLRVKSRCLAE